MLLMCFMPKEKLHLKCSRLVFTAVFWGARDALKPCNAFWTIFSRIHRSGFAAAVILLRIGIAITHQNPSNKEKLAQDLCSFSRLSEKLSFHRNLALILHF